MTVNNASDNTGKTMKQRVSRFFLIGFAVVGIACTLTIPFVYESQTLWYKVGVDKTFLRAGQLLGLLALISLIVQIFFGSRGKVLEETFGVAALMAWHRANGILLCCLVSLHIALVLVPEGIANLPIGVKHWPEMVGGVLFLVIFSQVISSFFRQQLGFIYKQWRMVHRALGYLALCLAAVHVLFVADSFAQGVPRIALLVMLVTVFALIAVIKASILIRKIKDRR